MDQSTGLPNNEFEIAQSEHDNVNKAKRVEVTGSNALQHEQLSVPGSGDTAGILTAAKYAGANQAYISVENNGTGVMRWTKDGTAPTGTGGLNATIPGVGHIQDDGDIIKLTSAADIANFKFIGTIADPTAIVIEVTYSCGGVIGGAI
jgi:hypothetical protein